MYVPLFTLRCSARQTCCACRGLCILRFCCHGVPWTCSSSWRCPHVSLYVVSLLLFLDVRNMFNVSCVCGNISLHGLLRVVAIHGGNVGYDMILVGLCSVLVALVLWYCASTFYLASGVLVLWWCTSTFYLVVLFILKIFQSAPKHSLSSTWSLGLCPTRFSLL